jgi:hypothetical protein
MGKGRQAQARRGNQLRQTNPISRRGRRWALAHNAGRRSYRRHQSCETKPIHTGRNEQASALWIRSYDWSDRHRGAAKQSQFPWKDRDRGTSSAAKRRHLRQRCKTKPISAQRVKWVRAGTPGAPPRGQLRQTNPISRHGQNRALGSNSGRRGYCRHKSCETNPICTEHCDRQVLFRKGVMIVLSTEGSRRNKANFPGRTETGGTPQHRQAEALKAKMRNKANWRARRATHASPPRTGGSAIRTAVGGPGPAGCG